MNLIPILKKLFGESKPQRTKKTRILEFIENNSSKSDFLHYLLNNTKGMAFSEEDSWTKIKSQIEQSSDISYAMLRNYAINLKKGKITEEALSRVIQEAEEAEQAARRLTFLGRFKKFSIAIGGALLFLGITKIVAALFLVLGPPELIVFPPSHFYYALTAFLGVTGITELLGGIFLVAM